MRCEEQLCWNIIIGVLGAVTPEVVGLADPRNNIQNLCPEERSSRNRTAKILCRTLKLYVYRCYHYVNKVFTYLINVAQNLGRILIHVYEMLYFRVGMDWSHTGPHIPSGTLSCHCFSHHIFFCFPHLHAFSSSLLSNQWLLLRFPLYMTSLICFCGASVENPRFLFIL